MELLIVVLVLLVVAGFAFAWMKYRSGTSAGGVPGRSGGVRGGRRTTDAARHDPMAEAVERHSAATDPHEAAEAELQLQAQANRVASQLHAREADALESQVGRGGGLRHADQRDDADGPAADGREPAYLDEQGRPVYEDDRPRP